MKTYREHFNFPAGSVYLNCAAQGPMPNVSADVARKCVNDKQFPVALDQVYGEEKTWAARLALSKLIDWQPENIALADSTSWGINVLVQGLDFKTDDEILMVSGQFPSNAAPWETLKEQGVKTSHVIMPDYIFDFELFKKSLTPKTRVVTLEWVHFISGDRIPLRNISDLCHERNILVVVDITQGVGAIPFSMKELKPDAVVCSAYKWLLSPYGTGFFAITDDLRKTLHPKLINWLTFSGVDWNKDLAKCDYTLCPTARRFDVFSNMGYLNLEPMTTSINFLNEIGVDKIFSHGRKLIEKMQSLLDPKYFTAVNQGASDRQSLISSFEVKNLSGEKLCEALSKNGIHVSLRCNRLRVSPNFYNSDEDVVRFAKLANQLSSSGISTTSPSNAAV